MSKSALEVILEWLLLVLLEIKCQDIAYLVMQWIHLHVSYNASNTDDQRFLILQFSINADTGKTLPGFCLPDNLLQPAYALWLGTI